MLEIYAIVFSILYLTVEVRNEENSTELGKELRFKRDSLSSFGRDALPSRANDGHTDDIIYGFVGSKKRKSTSSVYKSSTSKKKGKKRFTTHFRGEEEEEPSSEEMIKDVSDLREDIEALKTVLRNEEEKLEDLEDLVERRSGGRSSGRYWPYSSYYY